MNAESELIKQILRTNKESLNLSLITDIRRLRLSDFAKSKSFKHFVKDLTPHLNKKDGEWNDNVEFLSLLHEVNNQIYNQFIIENKEMTIEKLREISTKVSLVIAAIIESYSKLTNTDGRNLPHYKTHNLLLVMPANQLPKNLATGRISNDKIRNLISNAVRAYCFAVGDEKGNQVMNAVKCSDTQIDFTTEDRVFVQLKLSAQSDITTQRNKLTIREMLAPDSDGEVLQIKNLESARSASESTGFYKI